MYAGALDEPATQYASKVLAEKARLDALEVKAQETNRAIRASGLFQVFQAARVGEAHAARRCRWRRSRSPGWPPPPPSPAARSVKRGASPAAVGVDVERAVRLGRDRSGPRASAPARGSRAAWRTRCGAVPESSKTSPEKAASAACCAADGARDEQVLRQLLEVAHRALGQHHPAQPPAGHAEVLGEAVDQHHLAGQPARRSKARVPYTSPW